MLSRAKSLAHKYLPYLILTVAILLMVPFSTHKNHKSEKNSAGLKVRCAIALGGYRSQLVAFSTGFNYELMQKVGAVMDWELSIELADSSSHAIDSLAAGAIDILVLPPTDSTLPSMNDIICTNYLEDSTVWAISKNGTLSVTQIDKLLDNIRFAKGYDTFLERFSPKYEPFSRAAKGYSYKFASPYDSLFAVAADTLVWDWRLVAALVWQESRFRIEAKSSRGASGLMQLMPSTALAYNGSTETLDPALNMRAATAYLLKLKKMFSPYADGSEELVRFTLAAYNAGEGRLKDCISFAKSQGYEGSRWEEIKKIIPLMNNSRNLDSAGVRLGAFKGMETIAYIDNIDSLYKAFKIIKP